MNANTMRKAAESRWRPNDPLYNNMLPRKGNRLGEAYPKQSCDGFRPLDQVFIHREVPTFVPGAVITIDHAIPQGAHAGIVVGKRFPDIRSTPQVVLDAKEHNHVKFAGLVSPSHRMLNMF